LKKCSLEGNSNMSYLGGEEQSNFVLYKNKKVPKRKIYRLGTSASEAEVKAFIDILKKKFRHSSIEVAKDQEFSYLIRVEGRSLEDPSCIINIKLHERGESSTEIDLDLNFTPYYKKVYKTGFIGVLVVFAVLTVSVGALNLLNLLSWGYLFGSVCLFTTSFVVLNIFVWNKSLTFHATALEALYRRLDSLEGEVIDKALQCFRENKQIKPKEKVDTCYHCGAQVPSGREPSDILCRTCQELLFTCSVCLLNIDQGTPILLCPHCNSPAHPDHLREWLKIKNTCPYCKHKITEDKLIEQE